MKKISIIKIRLLSTAAIAAFSAVTCANAALFIEEFDGTAGYAAGGSGSDGDWVDFSGGARITGGTVGSTTFTEGYTTAAGANGESVLQGIQNHGDAQVRTVGSFSANWSSINLADITAVTLRLRLDMNKDGVWNDSFDADDFGMSWGGVAYDGTGAVNPSGTTDFNHNFDDYATPTITADGAGSFYLVTWSGLDLGNGTLESIRIDPRDGGTAASRIGTPFEIDRIEVIPEPATLGMVAAMGGAILFIRRRFMM